MSPVETFLEMNPEMNPELSHVIANAIYATLFPVVTALAVD
jgi:hypothetical protein